MQLYSLTLVMFAVIMGGHFSDAFLQPVIPDLQPMIKDAVDRLGRRPRSLSSTIDTPSKLARTQSNRNNMIDNKSGNQKSLLDDLLKQSTVWATEASTRMVQDVTWLATHEDSPAIPMAVATQKFVTHRLEDVQSHWRTHGDDYQRVVQETTEGMHRDILSWSMKAWDTLSSDRAFPLKGVHDFLDQLQITDEVSETAKNLYFLSDVKPELENESPETSKRKSSKAETMKDGIKAKAQKSFSFLLTHGAESQQKLSEAAESIGRDVVNWGRKISKNKRDEILVPELHDGLVPAIDTEVLDDDIVRIVQEAVTLEALVNEQLHKPRPPKNTPPAALMVAEGKQTKFPAYAVAFTEVEKPAKQNNHSDNVQRELLANRLQYEVKERARPIEAERASTTTDTVTSSFQPKTNAEVFQRALLKTQLQYQVKEKVSDPIQQKVDTKGHGRVNKSRQANDPEFIQRALLSTQLHYKYMESNYPQDRKGENNLGKTVQMSSQTNNPEVFQRALMSTRLQYELDERHCRDEQKVKVEMPSKLQMSHQQNDPDVFQRALLCERLRMESEQREPPIEIEGQKNRLTVQMEKMSQHRNFELFLKALLKTQSQEEVEDRAHSPQVVQNAPNLRSESHTRMLKSRQQNNPEVFQRALLEARLQYDTIFKTPAEKASVESHQVTHSSRQINDPEVLQRALLSTRFSIELKRRLSEAKEQVSEPQQLVQIGGEQRYQEFFQRKLLQTRLHMDAKTRVHYSEKQVEKRKLKRVENDGREFFRNKKQKQTLDIEESQVNDAIKSHRILANAAMGLTAPTDLLRDEAMKSREEEVTREYVSRDDRKNEEQKLVRELMDHISRAGIEKKQTIVTAQKNGLLAASARTVAEKKPTSFQRPQTKPSSCALSPTVAAIVGRNTTRVDRLNHQIRVKYEEAKDAMHREELKRATFVVEKLERRGPSRFQQGATALIRRTILSLLRFYVARFRGTALHQHVSLFSAAPKDDQKNAVSMAQT